MNEMKNINMNDEQVIDNQYGDSRSVISGTSGSTEDSMCGNMNQQNLPQVFDEAESINSNQSDTSSDSEYETDDEMESIEIPGQEVSLKKDSELTSYVGLKGYKIYDDRSNDEYIFTGFLDENGTFYSVSDLQIIHQKRNEESMRGRDEDRSNSVRKIEKPIEFSGGKITKSGHSDYDTEDFLNMKKSSKERDRQNSSSNKLIQMVFNYNEQLSNSSNDSQTISSTPMHEIENMISEAKLKALIDKNIGTGLSNFPYDKPGVEIKKFLDKKNGVRDLPQEVVMAIKFLLNGRPNQNRAFEKFKKFLDGKDHDMLLKLEQSNKTLDEDTKSWLKNFSNEKGSTINNKEKMIIDNIATKTDSRYISILSWNFENKNVTEKKPVDTNSGGGRSLYTKGSTEPEPVPVKLPSTPKVNNRVVKMFPRVDNFDSYTNNMGKLYIDKYTLTYLLYNWCNSKYDKNSGNIFLRINYYELFLQTMKILDSEDPNSPISKLLKQLSIKAGFDIDHDSRTIFLEFPHIIQSPYLGRNDEGIRLKDVQKSFIQKLRNHIMTPEPQTGLKNLFVWNQSFGGGKTTCTVGTVDSLSCHIDTAIAIVLPSKATAMSFSQLCINPYYLVKWNDEGQYPELIAPHEKTCPTYSKGKRTYTIRLCDKFRFEKMTLAEKLHIIMNFKPGVGSEEALRKGNFVIPMTDIHGRKLDDYEYSKDHNDKEVYYNVTWHNGRKEYAPCKIFFMDYASAVHARDNIDTIERVIGMPVKFIVDECVAAMDTQVDQSNNPMFQTLADLYKIPKDMVLLSASLNKNELLKNHYFATTHNITMSETEDVTNSFAQLIVDGKPVSPFNGLKLDTFNQSIDKWTTNCIRCFTPKIVRLILDRFPSEFSDLKFNGPLPKDIISIKSYLEYVKRMIEIVKEFNDESKQALINFVPTFPIERSGDDKELILTSGNLAQVILSKLKETCVTTDRIERAIKEREVLLRFEIQEEKKKQSLLKAKKPQDMSEQDKCELENLRDVGYLEKILKTHDFDITIETCLGKVTINKCWRDKWISILTKEQLAVATCGIDGLEFKDQNTYYASKTTYPNGPYDEPALIRHVSDNIVCDIEHCYGLNDHTIKHVSINDPSHIMGIDTVLQGIARAGRQNNKNPVCTAEISSHTLGLFDFCGSSSLDVLEKEEQVDVIIPKMELWCDIHRRQKEIEEKERQERVKKYQEFIKRKEDFEKRFKPKQPTNQCSATGGGGVSEINSNNQPVNTTIKRGVCKFFRDTGYCKKGNQCDFSHDLVLCQVVSSQPTANDKKYKGICSYFRDRGYCRKGDQCDFSHDLTQSNDDNESVSSVSSRSSAQPRAVGGGYRSNSVASTTTQPRATGGGYRSNPGESTKICEVFFGLKGRDMKCKFGDNCKHSHVAIAPNGQTTSKLCIHFRNGNCNLGSRCPRYHHTK